MDVLLFLHWMGKGLEPSGRQNVIKFASMNHPKKKDILSDVLYLFMESAIPLRSILPR